MSLIELIELAKEAIGSYGALADKLGCHQNRVTDWKKGIRNPDASKIACMAEIAGLPVLQTVAEIESQLDSEHASTWRAALGKLTAAGVAASLVGALAFSPDNANSRELLANRQKITTVTEHCILCKQTEATEAAC